VLPLFLPSFGALLFQKPFKRRDERAAGQTLSDAVEKVKGVEDPNIARYFVLMRTLIVAFPRRGTVDCSGKNTMLLTLSFPSSLVMVPVLSRLFRVSLLFLKKIFKEVTNVRENVLGIGMTG
jgi:hypothetical protein